MERPADLVVGQGRRAGLPNPGRPHPTTQLTHDEADFGELEWHPDGTRLLATRARRGRRARFTVDATSGAVTELAPGGVWAFPHWLPDGAVVAKYVTYHSEGHGFLRRAPFLDFCRRLDTFDWHLANR